MSEVKEGLFDKLYSAGKEAFDLMKKPLVKNTIKRKLAAAYDDANLKIGEAEQKITKTREEFAKYDINIVLEQMAIITQCRLLQTNIQEEYKTLFGKEMPLTEE